jgi:hypothetical protein
MTHFLLSLEGISLPLSSKQILNQLKAREGFRLSLFLSSIVGTKPGYQRVSPLVSLKATDTMRVYSAYSHGLRKMIIKDWTIKFPFIGEFYFEWRKNSKGKPFFCVGRYRRQWAFCTGCLCGYFAPFEP